MGHTPGPWFVNDDCIEAGGPEGPRDVTVAMVTGSTNPREANARLIAAAPALLAACQAVRNDCQRVLDGDDFSGMSDGDMFGAFLDVLSAAITKAEGRTNED